MGKIIPLYHLPFRHMRELLNYVNLQRKLSKLSTRENFSCFDFCHEESSQTFFVFSVCKNNHDNITFSDQLFFSRAGPQGFACLVFNHGREAMPTSRAQKETGRCVVNGS